MTGLRRAPSTRFWLVPARSSRSRMAGSGQSANSAPGHEVQADFSAQECPVDRRAFYEAIQELLDHCGESDPVPNRRRTRQERLSEGLLAGAGHHAHERPPGNAHPTLERPCDPIAMLVRFDRATNKKHGREKKCPIIFRKWKLFPLNLFQSQALALQKRPTVWRLSC